MTQTDRREHMRTALNARVNVTHDTLGARQFATRDISDGGVFVVVEEEDYEPQLGDVVTVQVVGLPVPAPELTMVVVRKSVDGFGLRFEET